MSKTLLIIISGEPCTGKTTLSKKIAKEFCLPLVCKDGIKESLFDDLGCGDREQSKKLGVASYTLLHYFMESLLSTSTSFIVESNFNPEFENDKFLYLKNKYNFEPFQIICKTNGKILFERFKTRSESGERHPGHADHLNYDEFKEKLLKGELENLNIGGKVIDIDTSDFHMINYKKLFGAIKSATNNK